MKEKIKCQAVAKSTGKQCENKALRGSQYCWHHHPKKEPLILLFLGVLLGFFLSVIYDQGITSPEEEGILEIKTEVRNASKQNETSIAISQEPVVHISEWCRSDDDAGGTFTITITNSGVNDVVDVKLYRDCYVHYRDNDGTLMLQRFGDFSTHPIDTIQFLASGQSEVFSVDIRDVYKEMSEFANKDYKNPKMIIVRLGAHFKRKADGKLFEYYRMYLIFGPATQLISPDTRGNKLSGYFDLPIDEVKQKLNCTE